MDSESFTALNIFDEVGGPVEWVELDVSMSNGRRSGIIDISATPAAGTPADVAKLLAQGLKAAVRIPTLISIDLELIDNYTHNLRDSISVRVKNFEVKPGGEREEVGPKLIVK